MVRKGPLLAFLEGQNARLCGGGVDTVKSAAVRMKAITGTQIATHVLTARRFRHQTPIEVGASSDMFSHTDIRVRQSTNVHV